jgi:hypothetical protein
MADQPDIVVTDGAASPPGHLTVSVDGHATIATPEEAKQIIAEALKDY